MTIKRGLFVGGKPAAEREIIYRDRCGSVFKYFITTNGKIEFVAWSWAEDRVCRGHAKYVDVLE